MCGVCMCEWIIEEDVWASWQKYSFLMVSTDVQLTVFTNTYIFFLSEKLEEIRTLHINTMC